MKLWEDAPKTEIYSFGLLCAIGTAAAAAVILLLCRTMKAKKGTGEALSFLSVFFGLAASRLVYCLLYTLISEDGIPFYAWFRLSTGGFSIMGIIPGMFAAAALSAALTGENRSRLLDIVSCAVPLAVTAERIAERAFFTDFDFGRQLANGRFPAGTFLSVRDSSYDEYFFATHVFAAICSVILFLVLVLFLTRKERKDGDLWILFLMLFGAGGVVLESLRADRHLEISFVYLQQILAALVLIFGVILAGKRCGWRKKQFVPALVSVILAVGACGGIEYALDRTAVSHFVLYPIMTAALAIPVAFGITMLCGRRKGKEAS